MNGLHTSLHQEVLIFEFYTTGQGTKKTTRILKRQPELNIANDAKSSPKAFWAYSQTHLKTKSGVAPLLGDPSDPSSIKHNDTDMAEVLQHQFCRVFAREPEGDISIIEPCTAAKLAAVEVTPDMVLKRLMKDEVKSGEVMRP